MIPDVEADTVARELIGQHGPFAPSEAAQRAQRMQTRGDQYGTAHWLRVKKIAEKLLAEGC
jgi:hypothetical protein